MRGYDSCGIASIDEQKTMHCTKFASTNRFGGDCIKKLEREMEGKQSHQHRIGVGHTRWATHGDKTDRNSHPHFDTGMRVAVVHNGIIENYKALKEELLRDFPAQVQLRSETDTELVAQWVGVYLDQGQPLKDAIVNTVARLEGTYSIVIISTLDPETIFCVKNSGTMVIGFSDHFDQQGEKERFQIVASDTSVFSHLTENFYQLQDKELVAVSLDQDLTSIPTFKSEKSEVQAVKQEGHEHFYTMEFEQQPEMIQRSLNFGARLNQKGFKAVLGGFDANQSQLAEVEHLVLAACGSSHLACKYGAYLMEQLGSFQSVRALVASEITKEDFPKARGGFLSISQSGETEDLLRPFREALESGLERMNIVNKVESRLARECGIGVFLNCGNEASVASTKAFTCQVVVVALVALWFAQNKNYMGSKQVRQQLFRELEGFHLKAREAIQSSREGTRAITAALSGHKHMFLVGTGIGFVACQEGALKIKELTYTHTQAVEAPQLANSCYAFLARNPGTPALLVVLDDQHKRYMLQLLQWLHSKLDLKLLVLSDLQGPEDQALINQFSLASFFVPASGFMSGLLTVFPLQRIAFDLTISMGQDPDRPRNLAKTITT